MYELSYWLSLRGIIVATIGGTIGWLVARALGLRAPL